MSERLTKRQLKHDQFLEFLQEAAVFARHHAFYVAAGLIVFVAAVALAVRIGGSAAGPRVDNSGAEKALSEARTQFAMGQMDAGRKALEQLRASHGGARAGREATYILANAYYESGDWAKAADAFRAFLDKPLYKDLMLDGAHMGLAACKEQSGDVAGALEDYKKLWTAALQPGTRIEAALSAARCARALGRPADARAMYQALIDAYPDATPAQDARFGLMTLGPASS
ncbi:MAG: tetratricopeptide repeat protein [bacterium]